MQQSLVRILPHQPGELFHVDACYAGQFPRILIHFHDNALQSGGRHLYLLGVLVEHRSVTHDFRDTHIGLFTHTGHTVLEIYQIRSRSGGVLGDFVDGSAHGQHGFSQAHSLGIAVNRRKFSDIPGRPLSQFVEGDVDHIGRLDIFDNRLLRGDSQFPGLLGKFVELLARRACIHRLERFVQSLDLFRRHAGEFAHIRHFAFHVRITLYSPPAGNGQAGYRGHGHRKGASPVVHFLGEPGPQRLMFFHRTLYGVQFPLHRFDFFYLGIPCGRSPLDIVELLPEGR